MDEDSPSKTDGKKQYLKKFLDFVDPFVQNSNIKALLRHALGGIKELTLKIPKVKRIERLAILGTLNLTAPPVAPVK